jgi:hypothetical protein
MGIRRRQSLRSSSCERSSDPRGRGFGPSAGPSRVGHGSQTDQLRRSPTWTAAGRVELPRQPTLDAERRRAVPPASAPATRVGAFEAHPRLGSPCPFCPHHRVSEKVIRANAGMRPTHTTSDEKGPLICVDAGQGPGGGAGNRTRVQGVAGPYSSSEHPWSAATKSARGEHVDSVAHPQQIGAHVSRMAGSMVRPRQADHDRSMRLTTRSSRPRSISGRSAR